MAEHPKGHEPEAFKLKEAPSPHVDHSQLDNYRLEKVPESMKAGAGCAAGLPACDIVGSDSNTKTKAANASVEAANHAGQAKPNESDRTKPDASAAAAAAEAPNSAGPGKQTDTKAAGKDVANSGREPNTSSPGEPGIPDSKTEPNKPGADKQQSSDPPPSASSGDIDRNQNNKASDNSAQNDLNKEKISIIEGSDGTAQHFWQKPDGKGGATLEPLEPSKDGKNWVTKDGEVAGKRDPYDTYKDADGKEHAQKVVTMEPGNGKVEHYVERPDGKGGTTFSPVEKSPDGKHWVTEDGEKVGQVDPYDTYKDADGKEHTQRIVTGGPSNGQQEHYVERRDAAGNPSYTPVQKSPDGKYWVTDDGEKVGQAD